MLVAAAHEPIEPAAAPLLAADAAASVPLHRAWYVLLVAPRHENVAAAHLVGRRFACYCPHLPAWRTRGARRAKVRELVPMFPGYLFVHLDWAHEVARFPRCEAIPGVHRFLRLDADYAVVPAAAMERIMDIERSMLGLKRMPVPYRPGEVVRILQSSR